MIYLRRWAPAMAGLFFASVGVGALWIARDDGAVAAEADRWFPRGIGISLVIFGCLAAAHDMATKAVGGLTGKYRPFVLITGAVISFATIIERGGLLPAVFASVVIAAWGSPRATVSQSITLGLSVAVAIAVLFVGLLGQSMKLLGGWR